MKDVAKNRRDIFIGVVVLIVLALGVYFWKFNKPQLKVPEEKSVQVVEQGLENKFKFMIPDDVEKAQLKDVTSGDASGIATRSEILVDILDPEPGTFYQAWLEKDGKLISLGKLTIAKGGWLLEYSSAKYPGYNKVIISQEKIFDLKIEERVLEGSF
ncbi:MAG: hypothetical protein AAB656_02505 [Patescibacteria group bacterium]